MLRAWRRVAQLGRGALVHPEGLQHRPGTSRTFSAEPQDVDAVIVGAGVVGLAVANSLALAGREVLVLEQAPTCGTETSSRNSEVIHAGIYYPPGSLKARLCVEGKRRLYEYCETHDVPYKRLGKLLVATDERQVETLVQYEQTARRNGVSDLARLSSEEAQGLEPELRCVAALLSPSTGVLDSHGLMQAYQADAERAGALFAFHSTVERGSVRGGGIELEVRDDSSGEKACLRGKIVVNSAGLHAQRLASRLLGFPPHMVPPLHMARGCYFSLSGKAPFTHLIYPMPEQGGHGLGTHLTLDMAGQAKFGPDVEWVDSIDYSVDPSRANSFYPAIRKYFPGLPDGALQPSYSGIRPKVAGPGESGGDFMVQGPAQHGIPGLVNLFGIESPGLTASLALADLAASLALGQKPAISSAPEAG